MHVLGKCLHRHRRVLLQWPTFVVDGREQVVQRLRATRAWRCTLRDHHCRDNVFASVDVWEVQSDLVAHRYHVDGAVEFGATLVGLGVPSGLCHIIKYEVMGLSGCRMFRIAITRRRLRFCVDARNQIGTMIGIRCRVLHYRHGRRDISQNIWRMGNDGL